MSKWLAAVLFSCSLMLVGCSEAKDSGELPEVKTDEPDYEKRTKEGMESMQRMQKGSQKSGGGN